MKIRLVLLLFLQLSCANDAYFEKAEANSAKLISSLDSDSALYFFNDENFSMPQIASVLAGVRQACDYPNRKGGYRGYYHEGLVTPPRTSFVYEFYLKCDSVRFILTYELAEDPSLVAFKVEPIEIQLLELRNP